jgi:hypothetical protein
MKNYVNPKTLKGQDKLNRMLDLMGKMNTLNESKSFSELELIKRGPNGIVYGIIRENHDYFIKTSQKNSGKFLSEDFSYIGGLQNKYDERYHSYSEALKHLNIKFDMLNESYGVKNNTNIFESDGRAIAGGAGFGFVLEEEDEVIISDEEKKVLKVDAPKSTEVPNAGQAPVEDEVSDEPDVDMGGDIADMDFGDDTDTEESDDEEGGDDTTKKIQKMTGKIGQLLRDKEEVDPELEKYVINSIISALHLDEMDESDKEDIIAKIEEEEEEGDEEPTDDTEEPVGDAEEPVGDTGSEELSEEVSKSEKPLEITPDMIAMLLKDGKCECSGHKLVYKERGSKKDTNESRVFRKKGLMETFLINETKKSLKKVLREERSICEDCMGFGCPSCADDLGNDPFMMGEEKFKDGRKKIDQAKPYGKITPADFEALRRSKKTEGRRDRRRGLMGEDEMTMMDAVQTGQGYLPTGDLDRDFDGVPNRLDMDNNSDGRLDFSKNNGRYGNKRDNDDFIELDIDFLRSNSPVKQPGIGTPVTKPPKEKKPWETIKRPQVDPRPKANAPVKEPGIDTPITKPPKEKNPWETIKRPKVDPRPKALDDENNKPSFRRRGMFR